MDRRGFLRAVAGWAAAACVVPARGIAGTFDTAAWRRGVMGRFNAAIAAERVVPFQLLTPAQFDYEASASAARLMAMPRNQRASELARVRRMSPMLGCLIEERFKRLQQLAAANA
jgi:hypothetical protein